MYIYIHTHIYTRYDIYIHSQVVQTINIHRQNVQLWRFNENCDPFELNMLTVVSDVSLFTGMSLVISNLPKSPGMIKLEGNHVASKAAGEHARFVDLFFSFARNVFARCAVRFQEGNPCSYSKL